MVTPAREIVPPECPVCGAVMGHDLDCAARARVELTRARATLERIRALHQPIEVPGIPGTSLEAFTRCSCEHGLLFDDCPTVQALQGRTCQLPACGCDGRRHP